MRGVNAAVAMSPVHVTSVAAASSADSVNRATLRLRPTGANKYRRRKEDLVVASYTCEPLSAPCRHSGSGKTQQLGPLERLN